MNEMKRREREGEEKRWDEMRREEEEGEKWRIKRWGGEKGNLEKGEEREVASKLRSK
jgi:hypothetical protein